MRRYASAVANRNIWNENSYLAKYFDQRFGTMNLIQKSDKSYPIYTSIDRLNELSARKDQMDQIEFGRSLQNEFKEFTSQLKLMNQREIAVLLNDLKDESAFTSRWSTKLIDLELRWILKSYLGTGLMDMDLSLNLAYIFYSANIRSTYVGILVKHLSQNAQPMTNEQLIFSLFLAMLTRQSTPMLVNYSEQIKGVIPKGSIQDIATICMTYFKTKTKIDDLELFELILNRTIELLPEMNFAEPGYCAIIKCLRYSQAYDLRSSVQRLVDSINDHSVMLTSSFNMVHTLKLMETYRIYDEKIFQCVYKTLVDNLEQFRIKDIQYILTSLSNFAFQDLAMSKNDNIYFDKLCKQIVRGERADADRQHLHVVPLMRALAMFGYYNRELASYADKCVSKSHMYADMSKTVEFDRSLLLLNVAYKLEASLEPFQSSKMVLRKISNSMIRSGNTGTINSDKSLEHLSFLINSSQHNKYLTISNSMRNIGVELATRPDILDLYKLGFQVTFAHQNYGDLILSKGVKNPGNFNAKSLMPATIPEGETHICLMPMTRYDYIDGKHRISGFKTFLARITNKSGYHVINVDLDDFKLSELSRKIKSTEN